jgi:hypothetical protein
MREKLNDGDEPSLKNIFDHIFESKIDQMNLEKKF